MIPKTGDRLSTVMNLIIRTQRGVARQYWLRFPKRNSQKINFESLNVRAL